MLPNRSPSWPPIFHFHPLRCTSRKSIWNLNLPPLPNSAPLIDQHLSVLLLNLSYVRLSLSPYLTALAQTTAISHLDHPQEPPNDLCCLELTPQVILQTMQRGDVIYTIGTSLQSLQAPPRSGPDSIPYVFPWHLPSALTEFRSLPLHKQVLFSSYFLLNLRYQLRHHILGEIFPEPLRWITCLTCLIPHHHMLFSLSCQTKCSFKSRIFLLCLLPKH